MAHRDAGNQIVVRLDLADEVELIAAHVGVGAQQVDHQGLVVDDGLGSVSEAHKGVECAHHGAVGELLELEAGLLGEALQGTGAKEYGAFEVLACNLADFFLIGRHSLFYCVGEEVDVLLLGLDVADMGDERAGKHHRRIAARHCQGEVVGLRREQYREDIVALHTGKLAVFVAGYEDMGDFSGGLLKGLDRRHALGAVAGTGERDEEDLALGVEIKIRVGQDVSRCKGTGLTEGGAEKGGLEGVAYIGRGAGAGQDRAVAFGQVLFDERADLFLAGTNQLIGLSPDCGLLLDLLVGVVLLKHNNDRSIRCKNMKYLAKCFRLIRLIFWSKEAFFLLSHLYY